MARPTRCRRVCAEPVCSGFLPRGEGGGDTVVLTVDEYEAIRLVDYEGRTHEQCAAQMEVSRTTVTEIYEIARFKLSESPGDRGGPLPRLPGRRGGRLRPGLPVGPANQAVRKRRKHDEDRSTL